MTEQELDIWCVYSLHLIRANGTGLGADQYTHENASRIAMWADFMLAEWRKRKAEVKAGEP